MSPFTLKKPGFFYEGNVYKVIKFCLCFSNGYVKLMLSLDHPAYMCHPAYEFGQIIICGFDNSWVVNGWQIETHLLSGFVRQSWEHSLILEAQMQPLASS